MKSGLIEFFSVAVPKSVVGLGTIATNIALLHFLGAEQYGILGLCLAMILFSDAIIGSSVDMGVLKLAPAERKSDQAASNTIQRSAFYMKAAAGAFLFLLLAIFSRQISESLFHQPGEGHLLYLTSAAASALLLLRSTQVQLQIEGRFGLYGLVELLHGLLRFGGITLLMISGKVLPNNVLVCYTVAPISILVLWLALGARGLLSSFAIDLQKTLQVLHCVGWYVLTFGLGALLSRMDVFFLAKWSSLREVGIFTAAQTFALVAQMLGAYLAVVTNPKVVPMIQEGRFFDFFRTFQAALIALCLVVYFLFQIAWSLGASRLLPDSYSLAGGMIDILLIGALAGLATFPVTLTFIMFVRPRFLFAMDCVYLPILSLLYFLIIPRYSATGAAWITTGANVSRAAIAQVMAWKWAAAISVRELGLTGPGLARHD